jgi:hypothetical protein
MAFVGGFLHLVEGASPEAMTDRFVGVLNEALVKKEGPSVAAMDRAGSREMAICW